MSQSKYHSGKLQSSHKQLHPRKELDTETPGSQGHFCNQVLLWFALEECFFQTEFLQSSRLSAICSKSQVWAVFPYSAPQP